MIEKFWTTYIYILHTGVHLLERTREMLHSLLLLLLIVSDHVMATAVALKRYFFMAAWILVLSAAIALRRLERCLLEAEHIHK